MLTLLPRAEKPAFSVFYRDWYQRTVQYISRKIGNIHDAEDLAGEVFLYCYSHYDNYDPQKSGISTWLFLIVNSRIKNYYRDNKNYVDLDSVVGMIPDDGVDMDDCIYMEQAMSFVEKAIDSLPERQKKAVRMRYYEQKTSEEIAAALGVTSGNARVLLSRAMDSLEKKCSDFIKGD